MLKSLTRRQCSEFPYHQNSIRNRRWRTGASLQVNKSFHITCTVPGLSFSLSLSFRPNEAIVRDADSERVSLHCFASVRCLILCLTDNGAATAQILNQDNDPKVGQRAATRFSFLFFYFRIATIFRGPRVCLCAYVAGPGVVCATDVEINNPRLVTLNFASTFCAPLTTSRHTQNIQVANEDAWKSLGKGANNESAPAEGNNQAWNDFVKQEEAKKNRVCYARCLFCRRTC